MFTRVLAILAVMHATFSLPATAGSDGNSSGEQAAPEQRLKTAAARIESAHISPVFQQLESAPLASDLSAGQIELSRRLERLAKDVLKSMVLRGLDGKTLPSQAELADRLGDHGRELRQAVVARTEAILLRFILVPDQTKKIVGVVTKKLPPPPVSRYGPFREAARIRVEGIDNYNGLLMLELAGLQKGRVSYLFKVYLDKDGGPVNATAEQDRIGRELEALTRDILRPWFEKHVLYVERPMDEFELERHLSSRWQPWNKRCDELVAYTESILTHAVLSGSQSDRLLKNYWKTYHRFALVDPDLGSRLGLTNSQRASIIDEIHNYDATQEDASFGLEPKVQFWRGLKDEAGRDLAVLAAQEYKGRMAAAEERIMEVLKPAQMRRLRALIDERVPAREAQGVQGKEQAPE
jgi:hypothetical protein